MAQGNPAGPGPSYFRVDQEWRVGSSSSSSGWYMQTRYRLVVISGDFQGSHIYCSWDGVTRVTYDTSFGWSDWYNVGYAQAGGSVSCSEYAQYTSYSGATHKSTVSASYTAGYDAPAKPTISSVSRVSDAKINVVFSCASDAKAKVTKLRVLCSTDGGSYSQVTEINYKSGQNTYSMTAAANHKYQFKVQSYNPGGKTDSDASSAVYTSPAAPSNISAVYTSNGHVKATWKDNSAYEGGFEIQAADNPEFTGAQTYTTAAAEYEDTNPPMGTAYYRVRSYRSALVSAWTPATSVVTLCAPAAPTITTPSSGAVFDMPQTITAQCRHNPLDNTPLSACTWAYSTNGTTYTEVQQSGSESNTFELDVSSMSPNTTVWIKAKTKGTYASFGPYCQPVQFSLRKSPSIVITNPSVDGDEVDGYPIAFSWSVTNTSGSIVETVISCDGWSRQLAAETSYTLDAAEKLLENGGTYEFVVIVRSSYGQVAIAKRVFVCDFTEPAPPVLDISVDLTRAACGITATANTGGEHICDGTEIAGAIYTFTIPAGTFWFVMPDIHPGDALVYLGVQGKLYLRRSGDTTMGEEIQYENDMSVFDHTSVVLSPMIAKFEDDAVKMTPQTAYFDEDGDWYIRDPLVLTFDEYPATVALNVYRIDKYGEDALAERIGSGTSVDDLTPPLNTPFLYRLVAFTAAGSFSTTDIEIVVDVPGLFVWNFGSDYRGLAMGKYNPDAGRDMTNNSESVLFEGDDAPTCFAGSAFSSDDVTTGLKVFSIEEADAFQDGLSREYGRRSVFRNPKGDIMPVRVYGVSVTYGEGRWAFDVTVRQERVQ